MQYRMRVGTADYGTIAKGKEAKAWLNYWKKNFPEEDARLEEVPDDAPKFLVYGNKK